MSIHGVRGPYGAVRPATIAPQRPDTSGTRGTGAAGPRPAVHPNSAVQHASSASQGVPVTPPQGTDPELWSVLTQDERTYFAKLGAMGPLTYGRALSGQLQSPTPHARGVRLDVKA